MAYRITLIPGDGIGPEVTEAAKRVLEATGVSFQWDIVAAGATVMPRYGTPLPEGVLESIRENKVALKGPVTTPVGSGFRSVNVALRRELDLYACIRPCKTYPGVPSPYRDVDIVIIRENTEDLYAGIEFEKGSPQAGALIKLVADTRSGKIRPDSGLSLKMISEAASRRIVCFAFDSISQRVIIGSLFGPLLIWGFEQDPSVLEGHEGRVLDIVVTPDCKSFISAASDDTIRMWDIDSCKQRTQLSGPIGKVDTVAIAPNGHFAYSIYGDTLVAYDLDVSVRLASLTFDHQITAIAVTPSGKRLAIGDQSGRVHYLSLQI